MTAAACHAGPRCAL